MLVSFSGWYAEDHAVGFNWAGYHRCSSYGSMMAYQPGFAGNECSIGADESTVFYGSIGTNNNIGCNEAMCAQTAGVMDDALGRDHSVSSYRHVGIDYGKL